MLPNNPNWDVHGKQGAAKVQPRCQAHVAQLDEHLASNQKDAGSNPAVSATPLAQRRTSRRKYGCRNAGLAVPHIVDGLRWLMLGPVNIASFNINNVA
jgi:hypothetical protein